jgi:hypothetical protein
MTQFVSIAELSAPPKMSKLGNFFVRQEVGDTFDDSAVKVDAQEGARHCPPAVFVDGEHVAVSLHAAP